VHELLLTLLLLLPPLLPLLLLLPAVSGVDTGLSCLMGACPTKCSSLAYNNPVCGSDGKTYPDK
jgi:hypothetical protein